MSDIISLLQVRHSRAKQMLEELTQRLEEDNVPPPTRKPITFSANTYDSQGRLYRGKCLKKDIFFERNYLQSRGIKDIKVYPAHNKDGTLILTHFAIYGRD